MNRSTTITEVINSSVDEGKKVLYLVLKKKSFSRQIIEEIEKEVEKRIPAFIQSITPKLENMKFKDKEQSLKVIILRGIINIIKKILEEDIIKLSESDRKALEEIMKEEEDNFKKENEKINAQNDDDQNNQKNQNNHQNSSNINNTPERSSEKCILI